MSAWSTGSANRSAMFVFWKTPSGLSRNSAGWRHGWASLGLLASALATIWLVVASDRPSAALVLAVSLLLWAVVAVVAILVEHSRFGYWLSVFALLVNGLILALSQIGVSWWIAAVSLGAVAVLFSDPSLGGWVRRRTSAAPVPLRAVLLGVILLLLPGAVSLAGTQDPRWLPALAAADWLLLFAYVRRWPGALVAARTVPVVLAALGWFLPTPARWLWILGQLAAFVLAWTREARLAVRPLVERGSRVMIPPELAPEEIRRMLERPE